MVSSVPGIVSGLVDSVPTDSIAAIISSLPATISSVVTDVLDILDNLTDPRTGGPLPTDVVDEVLAEILGLLSQSTPPSSTCTSPTGGCVSINGVLVDVVAIVSSVLSGGAATSSLLPSGGAINSLTSGLSGGAFHVFSWMYACLAGDRHCQRHERPRFDGFWSGGIDYESRCKCCISRD